MLSCHAGCSWACGALAYCIICKYYCCFICCSLLVVLLLLPVVLDGWAADQFVQLLSTAESLLLADDVDYSTLDGFRLLLSQ
jgi:predicted membrane metal-binding protein